MCSVVRMCSGTRYTGAPTAQVPFFRPIGKVPSVYLISSECLGFFSSLLFAGISHDHASFKLVSSLGSVNPSSTHASWLASDHKAGLGYCIRDLQVRYQASSTASHSASLYDKKGGRSESCGCKSNILAVTHLPLA